MSLQCPIPSLLSLNLFFIFLRGRFFHGLRLSFIALSFHNFGPKSFAISLEFDYLLGSDNYFEVICREKYFAHILSHIRNTIRLFFSTSREAF